MTTVMTTSRHTRWMAGTVAALGTVLTMGGTLTLADHYAQTGAAWDASGYYAAGQARRVGCMDTGNAGVADVSRLSGAHGSRRGMAA